ncbi:hypothetical protein [Salibaculum halophilum]|uniref:hypothetical protein n=1 Tax=Salibaculum halophilum TaxID=1914408 RepID=UPI000A117928|nr:hypothetical protein [Salibaculum halophilum]
MLKRTLPILALGAVTATPAPAQTSLWEAAAAPVMQDNGPPYCHMTQSDGTRLISFSVQPGTWSIGVYASALKGMDTKIEATLQIGNGPTYSLTMMGGGGGYTVNLTSDGMATVLDALILYGDEETRLTVGSESELVIPADGTQDAARTMWDCRADLPEG